MTENILNMR